MHERQAPGKPGIAPKWTSSQKSGIGSALSNRSFVWFTTSHGIVDEVYFPNIDTPNTRDMQFLVTDGKSFFSEEKKDTIADTHMLEKGIPAYHTVNTCKESRYRIVKTIFTNPLNNVLIQKVHFKPLIGNLKNYKLFVLLAPHVKRYGSGNDGWIGEYKGMPLLFAKREEVHLALGCSAPLLHRTCGYVGSSDGWQDIRKNYKITHEYQQAKEGNIALCAEIDLEKCDGYFTMTLGFGFTPEEAGKQTNGTLFVPTDSILEHYCDLWRDKQKKYKRYLPKNRRACDLFKTSTMVLNTHLDKRTIGSVIASLSIPWGASKGDNDLGGYHLIWPRDLVEIAGGFLAAGDNETARHILYFLMTVQEKDGHFNQCMWHDGSSYWSNIQMDETALPILLADSLKRRKALSWVDPWPLVEKATKYLIKHGPVTPQDRWEEDGGYTPFTLACEIAALLAGADFFVEKGLHKEAEYIRETADYWNSQIERWTYRKGSGLAQKFGVEGYYVRITPDNPCGVSCDEPIIEVKNRPPDHAFNPVSKIISCDVLALVRFGLRKADDPKILNTIKIIDGILKRDTKNGPCWRRYNEDGYGEHEDGRDFDGTGVGRSWPLLVGERGHYELAKGNYKEAEKLLGYMISQSAINGMIPEQIWDAPDIPERLLFNGGPTLGAMPLVWAHAEFIKLIRSLRDKKIFDMPPQTHQRYIKNKHISKYTIWRKNHKARYSEKGKTIRIESDQEFILKWNIGSSETVTQSKSKDSGLGIYYVDLPTSKIALHAEIHFSFFWLQSHQWSKSTYTIKIVSKEETLCS